MSQLFIKGKVALVGAGCGDPELLTIKGMRLLQQAEVVLTDRLVSERIIEAYVPERAEVIYVGKQCRKGVSTPQGTINELMVRHAKEGKRVVRLKGGDVSIFSNILDELEVLVQYHIPYEIVPGVTAALGAAAYAGIPLTARNHAAAVRFLTAYKPEKLAPAYWKELAETEDTLVFYMSSETLGIVVERLLEQGISPMKQLAIVEQATTPFQKVYTCALTDYHQLWGAKEYVSPSIVIIGKVVSLHQQFDWFAAPGRDAAYFPSGYQTIVDAKTSFALTA